MMSWLGTNNTNEATHTWNVKKTPNFQIVTDFRPKIAILLFCTSNIGRYTAKNTICLIENTSNIQINTPGLKLEVTDDCFQ